MTDDIPEMQIGVDVVGTHPKTEARQKLNDCGGEDQARTREILLIDGFTVGVEATPLDPAGRGT
jgi:hypothetical protein